MRITPEQLAEGTKDTPHLWSVHRTDGQTSLWFLVNTGDAALVLEIEAERAINEVPLSDGDVPGLQRHGSVYRRVVAPFESLLLRSGEGSQQQSPACLSIPLEGEAHIRLHSANLLRMDAWEMALDDSVKTASNFSTVSVPAVPLANQLAISGLRFSPVVQQSFGLEPRLALPPLTVHYRVTFQNNYSGAVTLVMEPDSIVGDWTIQVNAGQRIGPGDFRPSRHHVRGSWEVDITPHLQPGPNSIQVMVTTDRLDGGLLNPLYLAGDFGVGLHPVSLTERPAVGKFEAYEENGLPFYAGMVEYALTFPLAQLPDHPEQETVVLQLNSALPFREAAEISINGGAFAATLWEPRQIVVPLEQLRTGENEIVIRVYTTLIRAFEGQRFDEQRHRYQPIA